MSEQTPTLSEVIAGALSGVLSEELHTAMPAAVVEYDAATLSVSVQPLIKRIIEDEEGERIVESLPIINGVPVVFPGAGAFRITFPISAGDIVLLVFAESSIDKWLTAGGNAELDPLDERRFNLSDAIAIPGLRPFKNPTAASTSAMELNASLIHAGGTAALATKADIDDLKTYIATHAHSGVTTGGGVSGPPSAAPPSAAGTTVLKGA